MQTALAASRQASSIATSMRCVRRDALPDRGQPRRCEGARDIHHLAAGQRAERRVEVIEARIDELERDASRPPNTSARPTARRGAIGARAIAHPEHVARARPRRNRRRLRARDRPAGRDHRIDEAARLQRAERGLEMRLLAAPLRMAEPRQQHLAVEHDGGIGGEYQIGQAAAPAAPARSSAPSPASVRWSAAPFAAREASTSAALSRAQLCRVHPRIDGVDDPEMLRPAHQETRASVGMYRCSSPCRDHVRPLAGGRAPLDLARRPPRSGRAPNPDPRARSRAAAPGARRCDGSPSTARLSPSRRSQACARGRKARIDLGARPQPAAADLLERPGS